MLWASPLPHASPPVTTILARQGLKRPEAGIVGRRLSVDPTGAVRAGGGLDVRVPPTGGETVRGGGDEAFFGAVSDSDAEGGEGGASAGDGEPAGIGNALPTSGSAGSTAPGTTAAADTAAETGDGWLVSDGFLKRSNRAYPTIAATLTGRVNATIPAATLVQFTPARRRPAARRACLETIVAASRVAAPSGRACAGAGIDDARCRAATAGSICVPVGPRIIGAGATLVG